MGFIPQILCIHESVSHYGANIFLCLPFATKHLKSTCLLIFQCRSAVFTFPWCKKQSLVFSLNIFAMKCFHARSQIHWDEKNALNSCNAARFTLTPFNWPNSMLLSTIWCSTCCKSIIWEYKTFHHRQNDEA